MNDKNSSPFSGSAFRPSGHTAPSADAVLLAAAREGDEAAFTALVEKYRPLLDSAAAQYRGEVSEQDLEDLGQDALLAFHRAVRTYDPEDGRAGFGLYARACVNNALVSSIRRIYRSGAAEGDVLSLDDEAMETIPSSDTDPADAIIERENAAELRRRISAALSPYENKVWWMHFSGLSPAEIAGATGKSEKSVDNALCRIRRKLRQLLA